jgi:hypothetical protein
MKNYFLFAILFAFTSFAPNVPKEIKLKSVETISNIKKIEMVYNALDVNNCSLPSFQSFSFGFEGFEKLNEDELVKNSILTIVDYSLSSKQNRMWVIDLIHNKVLYHSIIAHGKNSGEDFATNFSNQNESNQSSLGFFATGETYFGKHGLSLRLDGLEKGINDNARTRAIVIHGADYVSKEFIKIHNRLGRSQGCPALPVETSASIINTIKNKTCLFIYHPSIKKNKLIS